MKKGYNDLELTNLAQACDEAFEKADIERLLELVDLCESKANNSDINQILSAQYLYCAFTSCNAIVNLSKKNKNSNSNPNEAEILNERSIYIARKAIEIYESILSEKNSMSENEHTNLMARYCRLAINYSNLLQQLGRIFESINILLQLSSERYPLLDGILGMKLYAMCIRYYERSPQEFILYKAYKLIKSSLEQSDEQYNENQIIQLNNYKNNIENVCKNIKFLNSDFSIKDFVSPLSSSCTAEEQYREWVANHRLALNIMNEIETSPLVAYDPLHLPDMLGDLETKKPPAMQSLFNQIKQEYVSARFMLYDGLTKKETHFSDKEVLLINTLDFPIYGLGLEKIKFAFRACYSILDSIAFLLNEYFELGLNSNEVSYCNVWKSKNRTKEEKISKLISESYFLHGMQWLFKDIRSSYSKEYAPNASKFKHIVNIRNAMEHRSLKIVRFPVNVSKSNTLDDDQISHKVSFDELEYLTLELFKYVRETIIMLIFAVAENEQKKEVKGIIMPIPAFNYLDEEKEIF